MKKALSLLLALLMVMATAVPAMATETTKKYEILSISNEKLFANTFGESANTHSMSNASSNGIIYNYNVTLGEDEAYHASIAFDVIINGVAHHAIASGTLDAKELGDGSVYLCGPLDGTIKIGNSKYTIIVGFQTEYGSDEISAGITLENESILHFAFGDYEMPDEIYETYQIDSGNSITANSQVKLPREEIFSNTDSGTYTLVGSASANASNISSSINFVRAFYNVYPNFLYVEVKADSSPLLTDSFYSTSRVYSTTTSVKKADNSDYPYIKRFVHYPGDDVENTVGPYIKSFFELVDAFSGIPIPLSTILSIYESATGSISVPDNNVIRTKYTLTTKPSSGDYGQGNTPPLPILWELSATITGTYKYTVTSDVRFVCTKIKQIYYVNAYTASTSFNLHVDD